MGTIDDAINALDSARNDLAETRAFCERAREAAQRAESGVHQASEVLNQRLASLFAVVHTSLDHTDAACESVRERIMLFVQQLES